MRLLLVTQVVDKHDPILGFFHAWIEAFSRRFSEVHVICLFEGEHSLPEHVVVHSLGKESGVSKFTYVLRYYRYFFKFYLFSRADFVFFHMGAIFNILAAPFFFLRYFKGTKFYWWKTHGHINLPGRMALMFVDRVYTAIAESFPVVSSKRHVVGHAIDTKLFDVHKKETTKESFTILFVGRLSRSKRVEQVLEIAAQLKENGRAIQVRIVGARPDNAYYGELEERRDQLQLQEETLFIGGVTHQELVKEYQGADIFINPSDNDGLDKVVLEAMSCRLIPLSANISFTNVLSPYGLYMRKGDIEGYVASVIRILDMDSYSRVELETSLREYVVENHSMDTITTRLFGRYD